MGKAPFAADDAGLPVKVSALEEHGDGGAGRAEGECLGGEGAGLLGGFGVGAVGVAPGALVAAFAAGTASSGGSVAVGDRARTGRGVHGAGDWAEVAALLWDGVTAFSPRKPGGVRVSANGSLRTRKEPPHQPPRNEPERHPAPPQKADPRGMPQRGDRGVPGVHLSILPKRSSVATAVRADSAVLIMRPRKSS